VQRLPDRAGRAIRLAILDDNPFVRLADGTIRPRAATFHRFAEAVVAAGPFDPAAYMIPVAGLAPGEAAPDRSIVDLSRLKVVPTAPFDGVAGYLQHALPLTRANWPVIRRAVTVADLVWIKLPASNALLGWLAASRSRRHWFSWVAGSARAVVRGQHRRGLNGVLAAAAATGYDGVSALLERTGPTIRLDDAMFSSVVTTADVEATRARPVAHDRATGRPFRLAWAGRIVPDKGLDDLLAALVLLRDEGLTATLDVIGDGPDAARLTDVAAERSLDGAVRWAGYESDHDRYFQLLREADVFVLPSRAEGVPKVVIEAMAAGLPVVASNVGAIPRLLDGGRLGRLVPANDPRSLADAVRGLADDAAGRQRVREAGLAFASSHTADAQAHRLVSWLRKTFPALPWPAEVGLAA
jgi:glycosyltransferase involved in cell wall biosynthesis